MMLSCLKRKLSITLVSNILYAHLSLHGRNNLMGSGNWVQDFVMLFIRIWWGILRAVIALLMMLRIQTGAKAEYTDLLAPPKHYARPSPTQNAGVAFYIRTVFGVLGLLAVFIGILFVGDRFLKDIGLGIIGVGFTFLVIAGIAGVFVWVQNRKKSTLPEILEAPILNVYTITLPQRTKWEPRRALQFMEYMLHYFDHLVFRIEATHEAITWQITELSGLATEHIEHAIRASYPDAEVQVTNLMEFQEEQPPFFRYLMHYSQANEFVMPIQYVTEVKDPDPLALVAQAMNDLQVGERIVYTLIVVGASDGAYNEGRQMVTQSSHHALQYLAKGGVTQAAVRKAVGKDRIDKYVPQLQRVFEEKLANALYQAAFFVQIETPNKDRIRHLALVNSQIALFTRYPYNALKWLDEPIETHTTLVENVAQDWSTSAIAIFLNWIAQPRQSEKIRRQTRLILEPRELALIWHLPHIGCTATRIIWMRSHQAPLPAKLVSNMHGVCLGEGRSSGRSMPVLLHAADRVGHINIVGKTAVGKSTLLHHMVHQDIANGHGVAVIDPHGTLVRDILHISIPEHRLDDVVVLDLADRNYPPPLSPLRGQLGDVRIGHIISSIERLFPDTVQYARLSRYLRAALGALQADPQATIRDLGRIFIDDDYRATLFTEVVSDDHFQMWQEYEDASEGEKRQIREPILSRISPFYGNSDLYPILCHPDTLDFRQLIRQKKIILVSLKMDEEYVPEQERNLVGALLISRLQLSGMQDTKDPYYIYIDEVQRFITSSLDEMFSEARKFGLSLTVAHQFLGQLPEKTLEAILGNVAATVMFQCSPADAKIFGPYVRPQFQLEDLVNLNKFDAAVKLQYEGVTQRAFTLHTNRPLETPIDALEIAQCIRERSRQNYTPKTRSEVMTWLHDRYPRPKRPQPSVTNAKDPNNFYDQGQGNNGASSQA
jgi:hypothetical protein